jgi:aminopeptidase N
MLVALLILSIAAWCAVGIYSLGLLRSIARRAWIAVLGVAAAIALSAVTYREWQRNEVRELFRRHYEAGIDERQHGNLEEAERRFREAARIIPDSPEVERQLRELEEQKPAEKRIQTRAVRVDPGTRATPAPPPAPSKPAQRPGKQPKPLVHLPSPFEIRHYDLELTLDPEAHSLDATATIQVRSRGREVPLLDFSLHPECRPSTVEVDGKPARFRHTNDLLSVTPPRPLHKNGTAVVRVAYARRGEAALSGSAGYIAPEGIYFISEARWYPATGELDFRSPVRLRATVPKAFTVVSVGSLRGVRKDELTSTFHWETERSASMVSLAAARYVSKSVQVPAPKSGPPSREPLTITCYTFPRHQDRAADFLREARAAVGYYERHLGTYPFEKLALAEIPLFPGGYGSTSFVMLVDRSFETPAVPREFLAHEIAHQWWGNSVFPQGMGAAWLTEAFANYSAWMFDAAISGNPRVLRKRVAQATRAYFRAVEELGDQSIYESDPYLPVGARTERIYEKGAVVLHMLRREIGDAAFQRALRRFADRFRFGKVKIEDFRKVAEEEHGQPLGWFFDQWLGRQGGMALAYSFETRAGTPAENEAVLRMTQAKPAYHAKMKVVLQVENSVETREIKLTQEHHEFRFPVKGKLQSVLLDPDNDYLMKPPKWVVPASEQQ